MAKTKRKKTEIVINDGLKLIRTDPMNWTVCRLTEKQNADGTTAQEWTTTANYFSNVEHALTWIAHRMIADSGEQLTLEQAVERIEKSHRKLARDVAKALEQANV